MSKRDRFLLAGTVIGGLIGGSLAYFLAPSREPGEETSSSLMAGIGVVEGLAIARAALGFIGQIRSVRQKGVQKRNTQA